MWDLATCSDGEPNVVPVAFKDVTDDGKLHVRFYSPRPLAEVLVKARIPVSGDEYFDLAWFDNIPAFADFTETLPMTQRRTWYRTESGKIMEIHRRTNDGLVHESRANAERRHPG